MGNTNDPVVITPEQDIVDVETRNLREALQSYIKNGKHELIVDFINVSAIDSAGIGVLIGAFNAIKGQGGTLKVINIPHDILHMFITIRLNDYFVLEGRN